MSNRSRRMSSLRMAVWVVLLLVLAAFLPDPLWACPNCKFAVEGSTAQPQAVAYATSIVFMLFMIMSLFAAMAGLLIWVDRREQQALRAAADVPHSAA
jgi:hypothetical protein